MPRNVWNDIVSWRTKRLNNSTKYQLFALTTIIKKKEEWKSVGELSHVCSVNKLARSITKWTKACDKRLSRLISYIHHTCEYNSVVMWVILRNNAGWDCFKTPILQDILRTQNLRQVEHYAFSEVIRLFQSAGCARNKLQFHTVQQN